MTSGGGVSSKWPLRYSRSTNSQNSFCSPRFHVYVTSWLPYWLPENIRTGTVSADITCTSVMAHTHVQLHCVAIYTPRGMGHAISIPRGMGYLSRPGYVRGGSARCTGRNSKFCYPEVLPTTNRLYRSGFIDRGPVVSELYGFENVNTAGMDGQTHGQTHDGHLTGFISHLPILVSASYIRERRLKPDSCYILISNESDPLPTILVKTITNLIFT